LFVNLYFQVFNLFKRLEFMRGGKEVNHAWEDRKPVYTGHLRAVLYLPTQATATIGQL
jgi:hypothetical protein